MKRLLAFTCCVFMLIGFGVGPVLAQSAKPTTGASIKPHASVSASASASPAPAPAPMAGGMGLMLKPDPKPSAKSVKDLKPEPRPSSLATAFLGGEDWSQYTLSGPRPAFVDGDQRMSLPVAEPSIELARFFNGTARTLVALTVWLTDQVLQFGIGQHMIPIAERMGNTIQTEVIGKIRLGDVALGIAIVVIALRAIAGNRVHTVRDTLIGILIVGAGVMGMATPHGPVCASLSVIGGLSRFFLTLTSGDGGATLIDMCSVQAQQVSPQAFAAIKTNLVEAFVKEPFMALQWGQLSDQCKVLATDIANAGFFGDSPEPRNVMSHNGCTQAANFNASAGIDRALYAGLHLLTVGGWAIGMGLLLAPMVLAQGAGVALIILAPLIWAVGVIPGLGHQALITWLYTGFKAALAMVISGALLAVVLSTSALIAPADQRLLAIVMPTLMVLSLAGVKWKQMRKVAR